MKQNDFIIEWVKTELERNLTKRNIVDEVLQFEIDEIIDYFYKILAEEGEVSLINNDL